MHALLYIRLSVQDTVSTGFLTCTNFLGQVPNAALAIPKATLKNESLIWPPIQNSKLKDVHLVLLAFMSCWLLHAINFEKSRCAY